MKLHFLYSQFIARVIFVRMEPLNMRRNCDLGITVCHHRKLFRGSHRGWRSYQLDQNLP